MSQGIAGKVFIAASLDGFIARDDGGIDWLMNQPTEGEDHGYDAFMASIDGLIMGRGSYEMVVAFDDWPYAKPVFVMSQTLKQEDVPAALQDKVTITDSTPEQLMNNRTAAGWKAAYIDGGQIIQSFLRAGLISELVVTHIPVLLGSGRPLFGALDNDINLEHLETKSFKSGLVQSRYKIG